MFNPRRKKNVTQSHHVRHGARHKEPTAKLGMSESICQMSNAKGHKLSAGALTVLERSHSRYYT
jgi:hypothetical protein